ncbi:MotA/TolQ/ExbB proton channel family protein [Luteolibacter flavescens]|uniref:MotA/TolQ/ExbB proton channel family protein n=1 Tax=Luteolibacter flavescens TaxID=1859460 RepID=A0ABT3FP87_9BACT|nr:MotA/TolQ/ExbB proton channel family protein [Luteolibacter flavescens]MCW1885363.1 MotA/TolQ/ExbB proton channel family protein [Luteolibacter flavescens]
MSFSLFLAATATTADAAEKSAVEKLWQFFADGGYCMILLLLCSFVMVASIFFKILSLRRSLIVPAGLEKKLREYEHHHEASPGLFDEIKEGRTPLARLCGVALRHRGETREQITDAVQASAREEVLRLHAGMSSIDVIVSLAPLLGLLGMASGLVVMFGGLGESPDPTLVSRGISEALNTTVFGLGLAVPAIVAHAIFLRRIDMFVARLEGLLAGFARTCEKAPSSTARPSSMPAAQAHA